MTTPTVAFFNNKGGVGKTTLVYHLAWMYHHLGYSVLAADLDPQANLSTVFLPTERMEEIWTIERHRTIYGQVKPLLQGIGDIAPAPPEPIADGLGLIVGDLALSGFEDELSTAWPGCLVGRERSFRVMSAFWRLMQTAARQQQADLVLMDLGPNLGSINRSALISADHIVVPLAPDLFSLQGLENLGPALARWCNEWQECVRRNPAPELEIPPGKMQPCGYIVLQHSVRLDRPVLAYERWIQRIPTVYRKALSIDSAGPVPQSVEEDPYCLALLKHYRSLMPLAQEARKPMFDLRPADGAIGAHMQATQAAHKDFQDLATAIAERVGVPAPR